MLLDLFVAWLCPRIEAETLVRIFGVVLAPPIPFQGVVGEIQGRLGAYVEHR